MDNRGADTSTHSNDDPLPWEHPHIGTDWQDLDEDQRYQVAAAVGALIEHFMHDREFSRAELSRAADVSDSYLSQIIRGKTLRQEGGFLPARVRRGTLLLLSLGLRLTGEETRLLLETALYEWHGENAAAAPLSALGNPSELTTAEIERLVAIGQAVLSDREGRTSRGRPPRQDRRRPTATTAPAAAAS